jgi:hypothetical protein
VDTVEESLAYYVALQKAASPLKCTCTRKAATPSACGRASYRSRNGRAWWKHSLRPGTGFPLKKRPWYFARAPILPCYFRNSVCAWRERGHQVGF